MIYESLDSDVETLRKDTFFTQSKQAKLQKVYPIVDK